MCKNLFWDLLHSNFIFDHIENGKKIKRAFFKILDKY